MQRVCVRSALLCGVASFAMAFGANAQTSNQPATSAPEEITVTASRVISNGNENPTPTTVVSADQLTAIQPTTLVDALNLLPSLMSSQTTTTNPGGGQRNGSGAYLNLRNLGDIRTLVLYDGNRVIPTINQNQADVDSWVIPQMLIQRVDVVTGGVSAVYGSDAVAGVVNFITDTKFNGIKFQAETGISTYGDDAITDVGIAAGTDVLDGHGHFEASFERHSDPGIGNKIDRPFWAQEQNGAGSGTAASPYYDLQNERMGNYTYGGLITCAKSCSVNNYMFLPGGGIAPFVAGTPVAAGSTVQSGGDGAWYYNSSLKSALMFDQEYARFDYDFPYGIHGFLQAAGTQNHTWENYASPVIKETIGNNNPFVPASVLSSLATAGDTSFTLSEFLLNSPRAEQHTDTYMLFGGLNGKLWGADWDVGFQSSQSTILEANDANVSYGNLYAASNVVLSGGQPVCAASLVNPAYGNCVPLNLFGQGSPSQAALNYITKTTWNQHRTTLNDVHATIKDEPFSTWAGPVDVALSGEWREETWDIKSNANSALDLANCLGIQYNCTQGTPTASGFTPANATTNWEYTAEGGLPQVSDTVSEGAVEALVPLAKDWFLAKQVDLNLAGRFTSYSTSGDVETWKVGLHWQVTDDLSFRYTASRDIRAPNLFELYSPTTTAYPSLADPVSHQTATVDALTIANPNLHPEKANTNTLGAVYEPSFLPGFSASLDAYRIDIKDVIEEVQGQAVTSIQACVANPASPVCALIIRGNGPGTFPTLVLNEYENIASWKTYGLDAEVNYSTSVWDNPLMLRGFMTFQPHFVENNGPSGIVDYGNTAENGSLIHATPGLRMTAIAEYSPVPDLNVTVMERWREGIRVTQTLEGAVPASFEHPYDPSIGYTDMNFSYTLEATSPVDTELFLNISNLFNAYPKLYYAGPDSKPGLNLDFPDGDDVVGRYFMMGVRLRY